MRNRPFPLAAAFALILATSSHAAEKPLAAQQNSTQPKKVWTNDDMGELRTRGLISIAGQEAPSAPAPVAPTATETAAPAFPVYASRLDDPSWYAEQAADWQAELDRRTADLQKQQEALALARDRVTQPGVAMDKPSVGVTPDAAIALLQAAVDDAQSQLDALADLARQHDIPPAALRG